MVILDDDSSSFDSHDRVPRYDRVAAVCPDSEVGEPRFRPDAQSCDSKFRVDELAAEVVAVAEDMSGLGDDRSVLE